MRFLILYFLFCFGLQTTFAQNSIEQKMAWYALAKPTSNLFVHFDKNVYSNNETSYFTGYLIKEAKTEVAKHTIMSVALIRDVDSTLLFEDKFLINEGLAFGSLVLPDSIPTGNYRFLAYTDRLINGMPEAIFIQNITIKSSIDPAFKANIKLAEAANAESKSYKVLIAATTRDDRFLPKPIKVSYKYGNVRKNTLTDASGQSLITLTPQNNLADPNIYVKLKSEKDSSFINLALPQTKNKALVKFYPEGGNMVAGLSSTIGWEAKDQQQMPLALKAFLYKNKKVIDTIETSSYGIGKFNLTPEIGADYTVKLVHSGFIDTLYHLPMPIEKGLTLNMQNAIAKDTVRLNLKSNGFKKFTILVHNFRTSFLTTPFEMDRDNINIKIPLSDVPKGLTTITIIDSLNRPLAERMFFAHYDNAEKISITTDQKIYKQREKINLKLKLNVDKNALVSIACIQNNRLEIKKMTDIESYSYLNNELSSLPINVKGNGYKDINYLEQILLVKGWRRYTWQGLQAINYTDTTATLDSLKMSGQVTKRKEIKDSLIIASMINERIKLIKTTNKGLFNLNIEDLIAPPEKKIYLFVNGATKASYPTKILIHDDFTTMNQKLTKSTAIEQPILPSSLQNNAELVLKNDEKSIRLKEVVIRNKNDFSFNGTGANACGDYVCSYNNLNCRNHPNGTIGNHPPITGGTYNVNGIPTLYQGCTVVDQKIFFLVKGIHLQKEFYMSDYKDPLEPAFFSTIYWNYATVLNTGKETELSFYTSDITGKFRIVVQGITNKDVIYAEDFFEVKGK
ncbi:hypothetical protein GM921_00315 [Pedobacter sp. LMG 31464]|uniref:MG2 domain-containing protein n=1 Tax=Pedobacter planticolens TaxID=2679964 RepID=A0A923DWU1_9SPHI|nr:hypothetical protein [Pedobacter planticolens]MBB2143913.1 hypothetical protein [Pedobacter planticolens]